MAVAVSADEYKSKYEALILEKNKMELDFGQKRAQFRQLYLDVEGQVKQEKELTKELQLQVKDLTKKNLDLESEIEGVRIASQLNVEEQTESIKISHQEEIASLKHIYHENAKENQARLAAQFEEERNKLIEDIKQLESKVNEYESRVAGSTVPLDTQQQQNRIMSSISSTFMKKGPPAKGKSQDPKPLPSLDTSQQQVQKDVNAWKSIVAPLENEIRSLKAQLDDTKKNIESSSVGEQEIQEMKKVVESERSARTDLEMYVAVLNTQKGVLQEDTDKLKRELHNVCRLFEQEKMSHTELKQTWKLANEQFLDQQTKLFFELEQTKKLLTIQQLECVSKEVRQHNVTSSESSQPTPPSKATLQAQSQQHQQKMKSQRELLGEFDDVSSKKKNSSYSKRSPATQMKKSEKQPTITDSLLNTFFPTAAQAKHFDEHFNDYTQEKPLVLSSSSESDSDDDLNRAIQAQNQQRYQQQQIDVVVDETGLEETEVVNGHQQQQQPAPLSIHPTPPIPCSPAQVIGEDKKPLKKSNSSGDILSPIVSPGSLQEKSLSHGDVSLNTTSKSLTFADEVDSKMSLNETGWSTMSNNVYSQACMMCQNYEKQLQLVQKDLVAVHEKENVFIGNMKTLQADLSSEKEKFASLEKSFESTDLDTKSQISIYKTNQQEVDKQVNLLHSQFKRFQDDIVKEIKALSEERDRALAEIAQKEDSVSTITPENEEELKTEIMFLKDRMMAEQVDKEAIESVLQGDLREARDTIANLQQEVNKLRHTSPQQQQQQQHQQQQQQQQQQRQQQAQSLNLQDEDPPLLTL